jgi:Transposase DDE domain
MIMRPVQLALSRLDPDALAAAIGAWLANQDRPSPATGSRWRAVAVDGKTLRGARGAGSDGRPVHLLAAMDHTSRAVLTQHAVGGAPEEVPGVRPLLDGLDLAGVVVTADALHTHADSAEFLVAGKHAHYLFCVKANQPLLLARACSACPGSVSRSPTAPVTRRAAASSTAPSRSSPPTTSASPRRPGPAGHPQDPQPAHQHPPGGGGR